MQKIKNPMLVKQADIDTLKIDGITVTASAAELNKLHGAGSVVATGTPVAAIPDTTGSMSMGMASTTMNSILVALRNFGIVAT